MLQNPELWKTIESFDLDAPGGEYSFSVRLRSENNWTKKFTEKAILEYKKFIYLATVSQEMVSPSEIVDVVWHLHLIFTQNYEALCQLGGKKIEHIPSTHDPAKADQFKRAVKHTLSIYRENFGNQPEEIWLKRTQEDSLELEKSKYGRGQITILVIFLLAVVSYPLFYAMKPVFLKIKGQEFLGMYFFGFVILIMILKYINRSTIRKMVLNTPSYSVIHQLSAEEMIYMKYNMVSDVVNAKIDKMIRKEKLTIMKDGKIELMNDPQPDNQEEKAIIDTIKTAGYDSYRSLVRVLAKKPIFTNNQSSTDHLVNEINGSKKSMRVYLTSFFTLGLFITIGICRTVLGVQREKPVAFLIVLLCISLLITIFILVQMNNFRIRKTLQDYYKKPDNPSIQPAESEDWNYYMIGTLAYSTMLVPFAAYYSTSSSGSDYSSTDSGSSCGSGDSGSSCGGGCGGCGGD